MLVILTETLRKQPQREIAIFILSRECQLLAASHPFAPSRPLPTVACRNCKSRLIVVSCIGFEVEQGKIP